MFRPGHKVTTPLGIGTVVANKGFGQAQVNVDSEFGLQWFKMGELSPAESFTGWIPAIKGSIRVGDEVRTADGVITTVKKVAGAAWIHCQTRPQDHHINSLWVRTSAAAVGDFDACQPVVEDEAWAKVWSAWRSKFQPTHLKAIANYTGSWFRGTNELLRKGTLPSSIKYCDRLDQVLAMGRLDRDAVLYRSGSSKFDKATPVGMTFSDAGFGSTSIDKSFAMGWGASRGAVVFEIRAPKGTRGGYVASWSSYPNEKEFILPRNCQYRVAARREESGTVIFTVDLIGQ